MSTIHYTGITAYVKNTPHTTDLFRVLENAIHQLQPFTGAHNEDLTEYTDIMESQAFQFIADNASMFSPSDFELPNNTPVKYQSVELTSEEINDIHMTRLYIPVSSMRTERIQTMVNDAIRPVLIVLFGQDLITIKTKSSDEYSNFADAKETILVSAKRSAAPVGV